MITSISIDGSLFLIGSHQKEKVCYVMHDFIHSNVIFFISDIWAVILLKVFIFIITLHSTFFLYLDSHISFFPQLFSHILYFPLLKSCLPSIWQWLMIVLPLCGRDILPNNLRSWFRKFQLISQYEKFVAVNLLLNLCLDRFNNVLPYCFFVCFYSYREQGISWLLSFLVWAM